jgi:hypothetical protein
MLFDLHARRGRLKNYLADEIDPAWVQISEANRRREASAAIDNPDFLADYF